MKKESLEKKLREICRGELRLGESMRAHTSLRIGGPADIFIIPQDFEDLKNITVFAGQEEIPYFILGKGTNLLVSDKGIRGIVVKVAGWMNHIINKEERILAGSGADLSRVGRVAKDLGLSGLEFTVGIPGTVGGAVITNAGGKFGCLGDVLNKVLVVNPQGEVKILSKEDLNSNYRESLIKSTDLIVLETELSLKSEKEEEIEKRMEYLKAQRRKSQPGGILSAGSIFKNPNGSSGASEGGDPPAGYLIERVGAKGLHLGDAYVSEIHANFIINQGKAKAREVWELINIIKNKVEKKFGIRLTLEIEMVGEF